ncbi:MAG: quinolinate synthase NadA [candidate division Zixibacteria bacterium]|nr:quinolinate synthase NadA [candidate division Zixibacteria bacterium]
MVQSPAYTTTPIEYRRLFDDELRERILASKEELGKRLVILTHHYQRREVVAFGDFKGDSYALCKHAAAQGAEYIVFCGVHFMAEASVILARPEQKVYLPNPLAGCPMADMAPIDLVLAAWEELGDSVDLSRMVPITYMNSDADLKAFCGRNGGTVCTSSNAKVSLEWAYQQGERVFFFPDQHLGRNTGNLLGIPRDQIYLWDYNTPPAERDKKAIKRAHLILWNGYCHVHRVFVPHHVEAIREAYPDARIVVHPECTEDVVALADAVGSTSFIVKYVTEQPAGSIIAIGTDLNLIDRLAHENKDKTILELAGQTCAMCVNMYRTTLSDVAYTLDSLDTRRPMQVPEEVQKYAKIALEQMLTIAG